MPQAGGAASSDDVVELIDLEPTETLATAEPERDAPDSAFRS